MQLFSKRNNNTEIYFLKDSLRNRLLQEIEYLSSTDEFLERCFLVEDEKNSRWFLDGKSMKNFFLLEMGYDITVFFDFKNFCLKNSPDEPPFDAELFDLIEMILIFAKEDSRKFVRERFQKHFLEENNEYEVHDFLISEKKTPGIKPYVSFLKDKILKDRFEQYYIASESKNKNHILLAKISAEILQFLFSGDKKGETKNYTENLIKFLSKKCVDDKNTKSFYEILNAVVLNAKKLNNEIANIRHTDRSTLLIDNPSLFKLITATNLHLAELVIFSEPEKYFFSQKAVDFKNEYIKKYKIPLFGWVIRKPKKEGEIDPEDIPF